MESYSYVKFSCKEDIDKYLSHNINFLLIYLLMTCFEMLKMAMENKIYLVNTEMLLKSLGSMFVFQENTLKNMLPTQFKRGTK